MSRETKLIVTLTVAFAAADAFRSYLPPLWQLREKDDTAFDPALRGAELHAFGFAIAAGVVVSLFARSAWPLVGAAAMAALSTAQYEWGMKG